jgi:uncharacterized protein (TIGR02246 family)
MTSLECVRTFVAAVNARDLGILCDLMTEDHVFIDSNGEEVCGREAMRAAWSGYFKMMTDYKIHVRETYASDDRVILIGIATGTYAPGGDPGPGSRWEVPAAWRAVYRGGRLGVWQVFTNLEPVLRAIKAYDKGREPSE